MMCRTALVPLAILRVIFAIVAAAVYMSHRQLCDGLDQTPTLKCRCQSGAKRSPTQFISGEEPPQQDYVKKMVWMYEFKNINKQNCQTSW